MKARKFKKLIKDVIQFYSAKVYPGETFTADKDIIHAVELLFREAAGVIVKNPTQQSITPPGPDDDMDDPDDTGKLSPRKVKPTRKAVVIPEDDEGDEDEEEEEAPARLRKMQIAGHKVELEVDSWYFIRKCPGRDLKSNQEGFVIMDANKAKAIGKVLVTTEGTQVDVARLAIDFSKPEVKSCALVHGQTLAAADMKEFEGVLQYELDALINSYEAR